MRRRSVGDAVAMLDSVDVLTRSIVREESENYLDRGYVLNFRDMAFLLL